MYISQVSGEHLQDHWSSGILFISMCDPVGIENSSDP